MIDSCLSPPTLQLSWTEGAAEEDLSGDGGGPSPSHGHLLRLGREAGPEEDAVGGRQRGALRQVGWRPQGILGPFSQGGRRRGDSWSPPVERPAQPSLQNDITAFQWVHRHWVGLEQGSPTQGLRPGAGLWPVQNRVTEVAGKHTRVHAELRLWKWHACAKPPLPCCLLPVRRAGEA